MGSLASDMEKDIVALSPAGHDQPMAPAVVLAPLEAWSSRIWRWPDPRATRRAGPPPLAVAPQLLGVLAEGGDQLILVHRRAALELQLSGPLAELLDAALLIGTPVELADLLGGLSLRGLRLLRIRLLLLSLDGFNEVLDSADALADGGLDRCHSGVDGLYGRVDLTGGDTGDGQRELALDGEGLLGDVEHAVHGAGEVDLGDRHPEGASQLLGDGRPGADGVDHGGLALADGAQQVALRVGVGGSFSRHVCSSQGIRIMRSIVRICMLRQAMARALLGWHAPPMPVAGSAAATAPDGGHGPPGQIGR